MSWRRKEQGINNHDVDNVEPNLFGPPRKELNIHIILFIVLVTVVIYWEAYCLAGNFQIDHTSFKPGMHKTKCRPANMSIVVKQYRYLLVKLRIKVL